MKVKYTFYVLIDPIDNKIKYVGRTISKIERRLTQHISESKRNNKTKKKDGLHIY